MDYDIYNGADGEAAGPKVTIRTVSQHPRFAFLRLIPTR